MVRQAYGGRVFWTLPGGGAEPGETFAAAAERELAEEALLSARIVRQLYVRDYTSRDGARVREVCFLATVPPDAEAGVGRDPEDVGVTSIVDVAWRPLADLGDDHQVARVLAALDSR